MTAGYISPHKKLIEREEEYRSAELFDWLPERHDVSEDIGQPFGMGLNEMTGLDRMTHAIVMKKGDTQIFRIKIIIPEGTDEYVFVLNVERIVFVARYSAPTFRAFNPRDLHKSMLNLARSMNARVAVRDGKDFTLSPSTPEDYELAIYSSADEFDTTGARDQSYYETESMHFPNDRVQCGD
ncbi:hypothetical protein TSTA_086580 [Talaromyces stipitatus ATCC 10500]|uniref:Uncharacterized protein n=1 Tax=Talaromyces stipitatus (strain ATCC 10500 / CBS 375.48 / QM 6759 / NRRL 1006) TaxID=441959 RepID=B8M0P2_TALSN|nr:uncharacterized protein TSTA_086580 [Talaromyces stipitatus ATCC 10500]EED21425.1 hypothetical protein TSTA_086580 [Talaromyces stipitatus ATCC 10500]